MMPQSKRTILTVCLIISSGITGALVLSLGMAMPTIASTNASVFTVIVSHSGFNGSSTTLDLTVHQGDLVRITFVYGDGNLSFDNPHAIMIEGYAIQTAVISKSNPNATLQFFANQAGTFRIYCNIPCNGMSNLQSGALVVLPAGGRTPTQLNLTFINETTDLLLSARVQEFNGTLLTGVPVQFYENTSFGPLWLHSVLTSPKGEAKEVYTPERSGNIQIVAAYPGNATLSDSVGAVTFLVPGNAVLAPGSGFYGITFPFNLAMIAVPRLVNFAVVVIVGTIVLSIWSNYAYILREILSLRKSGNEDASEIRKRAGQLLKEEALAHRGSNLSTIGGSPSHRLLVLVALSPLVGVAGAVFASRSGLSYVAGMMTLAILAVAYVAVIMLMLGREGRR